MIEGAIVALPFFILIFGLLEMGLLLKTYLGASNVVTTSARSASTWGSDGRSDFKILETINQSLVGINQNSVGDIVIFHASGPDDTPSANCLNGTGWAGTTGAQGPKTGACNVYTVDDFAWAEGDFDCLSSTTPGPVDYDWCPSERKDWTATTEPGYAYSGTDYIGIYIEIDYNYVSGIFGDTVNLNDQMIVRIEPAGKNK